MRAKRNDLLDEIWLLRRILDEAARIEFGDLVIEKTARGDFVVWSRSESLPTENYRSIAEAFKEIEHRIIED